MPTTGSAMGNPISQVFGSACSAVPKDGKGSFSGMASDPVGSAASNNPLLSTLVTAVKTDQLAREHKTLAGTTITVTGSGQDFTVGKDAHVICGNVPTANATVYLIDSVLMP